MLRTELDRVRSAALAWRNGLGALMAGLIGFGLVKGRTDIGSLAPAAAAMVGVLLLMALLAGAAGAWMLLRAAHGRPAVVITGDLPPVPVAEHLEALAAARLLRRGTVATVTCAALLVTGVALTWYGPPRAQPVVQVLQSDGTSACGPVVRVAAGALVVKSAAGERTIKLADTIGLRSASSCDP